MLIAVWTATTSDGIFIVRQRSILPGSYEPVDCLISTQPRESLDYLINRIRNWPVEVARLFPRSWTSVFHWLDLAGSRNSTT